MAASCCWCHQLPLPRCPSLRRTRPADFSSSAANCSLRQCPFLHSASQPRPTSPSCSASWPSAVTTSPSRRASWPSTPASRKELHRRMTQWICGSSADRHRPGDSPSSGAVARPGPPLQWGQSSSSPRRRAVRWRQRTPRSTLFLPVSLVVASPVRHGDRATQAAASPVCRIGLGRWRLCSGEEKY